MTSTLAVNDSLSGCSETDRIRVESSLPESGLQKLFEALVQRQYRSLPSTGAVESASDALNLETLAEPFHFLLNATSAERRA